MLYFMSFIISYITINKSISNIIFIWLCKKDCQKKIFIDKSSLEKPLSSINFLTQLYDLKINDCSKLKALLFTPYTYIHKLSINLLEHFSSCNYPFSVHEDVIYLNSHLNNGYKWISVKITHSCIKFYDPISVQLKQMIFFC